MALFKKKKLKNILEAISRYNGDDLRALADLVNYLRPRGKAIHSDDNQEFEELILRLKSNEKHREGLRKYINRILSNKKLRRSITEPGIITGNSFFSELWKRLSYKILPYQPDEQTVDFVLTNIFYRKTDGIWVKNVPADQVLDLFDLLSFEPLKNDKSKESGIFKDVLYACDVLMQRVVGLSIEDEIPDRTPEYANFESPFLALEKDLRSFIERELNSNEILRPDNIEYKHLLVLIEQCDEFVEKAFKNSGKYGITLKINQSLLVIRQQLERVKTVLSFLPVGKDENPGLKTVEFIRELIYFNCGKNRVRRFITDSTRLLAFEVTQQTGKSGEHYITSSKEEYRHMFKSAAGGGAVVGLMCLIKTYLGMAEVSLFGKGFLYSMNYALGFIAIYLLHFTLATKQPAMTAAALAVALKTNVKEKVKYDAFSKLFARLFRSQFIAFVGNVALAFPVALIIVATIDLTFGVNSAAHKSEKLLKEIDIFATPALFHASIAGVFLFLSGLIAGQAANRSIHHKFPTRIKNHPALKLALGRNAATKLSELYKKHIGGLAGNFWFGIFMGSTASVGVFLGLPLDIRHITFAAGNLALGLYGELFSVNIFYVFWLILGVGFIGLMNFIVSFGLSLILAMKSRGIKLTELIKISKAILLRFKDNRKDFFIPPEETEELNIEILHPENEKYEEKDNH